MKVFEKTKVCWGAVKEVFGGEEYGTEKAVAQTVRRFVFGIIAGAVALGWFTMPRKMWERWEFGAEKVFYSVFSRGEVTESTGLLTSTLEACWDESVPRGPAKLVLEAFLRAWYFDSLEDEWISEEAAKWALSALVAGMVLLIWGVASRRKPARGGGVLWQLAGMGALVGDLVNAWTAGGKAFFIGLCAVAFLAFQLGMGLFAAFRPESRQWFGKRDRKVEPLGFLWKWALVVPVAAVVLALCLGAPVLGMCRDVGIATRDSWTGNGQVLVVQNREERPMVCALEIGDDYCQRFVLEKGETPFGILETGRYMEAGTAGRLSLLGHRRGISFSIAENKPFLVSGRWYHPLEKAGTQAYQFSDELPIAFGQKPSWMGGAVLEIRNTSGKETVQGTLAVNGGQTTAELKLGPGETKTFGRLELLRAFRKGDRAAVSLAGYPGEAVCEI